MLIGTAGHIDHGKTALVKALTGVDADRLQEEKRRGITLDLGYAYADLGRGDIVGFIDVPGHERLVDNMLAGITGIDFALLVVAADDGVMPQTREHYEILNLLGIPRGAIAITKCDRVDDARIAAVSADIRALGAGGVLAEAPLFVISSISGEGIAALRDHLAACAQAAPTARNDGRFRLAIDRVFTLAGAGTVVTGTARAGRVQVGDRLVLVPGGRVVRVRGLHAQNRAAESAHAGQRCALNLSGIEKDEIARGDWIVESATAISTSRIDVRLRQPRRRTPPVRSGMTVHVHIGTADVLAQCVLLNAAPQTPQDAFFAQLVLAQPIGAWHGDRVMLRDQSAQHTVAGGIVLDPFPPARHRRTRERLASLNAMDTADATQALQRVTAVSPAGIDLDAFERAWNHVDYDARDARVISTGEGRVAFAAKQWQRLRSQALAALRQAHSEAPDSVGLNGAQWRSRITPRLPWPTFGALVDEALAQRDIVRTGAWFHLPDHRIRLNAGEQRRWARMQPLLSAQPFQPPRVRDIARALGEDETQTRALLRRTALAGDTDLVAHDHYFLHDAVACLAHIALDVEQHEGAVRAAAFRDRIDTGRKLAIQILEYFDRIGFLRRNGDEHRLRNPRVLLEQAPPPEPNHGRDAHPGGTTGLQIR